MIFYVNFQNFFNLTGSATAMPFRDTLNLAFQFDGQADEKMSTSIGHRFTSEWELLSASYGGQK
jgi:hypothetical protein